MSKKASLPSGTRDFLPAQMRQRNQVVSTIRTVFESYGYEPLETPSFEKWDVLSGKLGDEGEQLLFKILRRGTVVEDLRLGKTDKVEFNRFKDVVDLALRYDLTLPFSRVLSMYQLPRPFKRYQIQPVWRADRPQKGRYREFYQCDIDIAGVSTVLADAELLTIAYKSLTAVGLNTFKIRLNHRKVINGLIAKANAEEFFKDITIAIDKLDKIGLEGVTDELNKRGIPEETGQILLEQMSFKADKPVLLSQLEEWLEGHEEGMQGVAELKELLGYLEAGGVDLDVIELDLYLMRGLDYYTGPIFEMEDTEVSIGSIGSGGRYDELIGKLSKQSIPATGLSLGLERILDVMKEKGMLEDEGSSSDILVTVFKEETLPAALGFANSLRAAGLRVETPLKLQKLPKQIKYASSKNIPLLAILGPDEIANQTVVLRSGPKDQRTVPQTEAAAIIHEMLQEK